MQYFSFLDDDQACYVHEASLEVLAEVGLIVRNEKARQSDLPGLSCLGSSAIS